MLFHVITLALLFVTRLRWPPNTSIAVNIEKRYGTVVKNTFRRLEKCKFKHKKVDADLCFLKTCRENDIIPKQGCILLHFR